MNPKKKLELISKLVNAQEDSEIIELFQSAIDEAQELIKLDQLYMAQPTTDPFDRPSRRGMSD